MIYTTATTKALKVEFILGLLVQIHKNRTDVILVRLKHLPLTSYYFGPAFKVHVTRLMALKF